MLKNIYVSAAVFSLHSYLVLYINSSFLGAYFDNSALGLLYIVGAILNVVLILAMPKIIAKIGIHSTTLTLVLIEALATLGMILSETAWLAALSFTLHQAMVLMILFMFDEYLEYSSLTEENTGRVRAVFLTISSVALVVSPSIAGALAAGVYGFSAVYSLSLAFLVPLFFVVWKKLRYEGSSHSYVGVKQALAYCRHDKSLSLVLLCRFILECFYAWMVIYMAIYLVQFIGFGWREVGVLFTIMLLPFVLFEMPLGALSDKFIGEKEILVVGFLIIAGATAFIAFITSASFLFWAAVLFMTRVGASFAEIGTESFFFKHTKGNDLGMISLFRATRPLSFVAAPAVATISLLAFPYSFTFLVLAGVAFCGSILALFIRDTR